MKKSIQVYLLAALVSLSILELNGYQSAVLFFCIAVLLGLIDKHPNRLIPPVAFVIVAYVLGFPMTMLWPDLYPNLWVQVSPDALEYAMLWAVRGFGAFALGYALVKHLGKRVRTRKWREVDFYGGNTRYALYVLTSIGWLAMLSWFASVMIFGISLVFIEGNVVAADTGAGMLVQIFTLLPSLRYPFFFGFILLYFRGQTDRHLFFLFVGLLLISVIEIIAIGSKGSIIRGIVVVLLASAFVPVRLNLKQVIAGVLALIAVYGSFAVITEYRSIMKEEFLAGRDVFNFSVQTESFVDAVIASLPFSESTADRRTEVGQEDILGRFGSGIFSFANLLDFTGRQPPYEHAWESFLVPVYSIAPRALVPDKPVFFHSGLNAQKYYGWSFGGISVSLMGSFYYAWGYAGIVLGMAFLGSVLAYVVRRVMEMGLYAPRWLILLLVLIMPMIDVGVTFQSITTNFIRVAVLLWLLHVLYPVVPSFMRRKSVRMVTLMRRRSNT